MIEREGSMRLSLCASFDEREIGRPLDEPFSRYLHARRICELVVILMSVPLLAPLLCAIAAAIRLESPGPALFRQRRAGKGRSAFTLLKFRTMHHQPGAVGPMLTAPADARITRIGRLLRRTHLDELPQLWNVLLGDMSLIGPRPEQVLVTERIEEVMPQFSLRRGLLPGLTGYAQVTLGYVDDLEGSLRKLELDLHYMRNISLRLDLTILGRTIAHCLTGRHSR